MTQRRKPGLAATAATELIDALVAEVGAAAPPRFAEDIADLRAYVAAHPLPARSGRVDVGLIVAWAVERWGLDPAETLAALAALAEETPA